MSGRGFARAGWTSLPKVRKGPKMLDIHSNRDGDYG